MKKILIVEDEPMIANDLAIIVKEAGFEVLAVYDCASDVEQFLKTNKPDLALLDINIKGEVDGISLAATFNDSFPYIFITSYYNESTLQRVEKVRPEAYILKPFREEEVVMGIRLAIQKTKQKHSLEKSSKIMVRTNNLNKPILLDDIAIVRGEDNYTRISLSNGEEYFISQTLKSVQSKLPEPQFARIHKSFVINTKMIDGVGSKSVYIQGSPVPIGRAYKQHFLNMLQLI